MATPNSSDSSLLSVTEYLKRCDKRTVARLCSDANTMTATELTTAIAALSTNEYLLAALDDAMGELESACLVGNKYTPDSLADLEGTSLKHLYRLLTRLTTVYLFERRPLQDMQMPAYYQDTMQKLAMLRNGERIFGLQENADAGLPASTDFSKADLDRANLASNQANRWFGVRGQRNRFNP